MSRIEKLLESENVVSGSSSPLAVSTPRTLKKLSGLSLLLDEDARIKTAASLSPMGTNKGGDSPLSFPAMLRDAITDEKDIEVTQRVPAFTDVPVTEFGSFYESYKSDDLEMLPDQFHVLLSSVAAPAKSEISGFSFDLQEEEKKEFLTCAELVDLILRFANTNEDFVKSPSSHSLWHVTSVRLVAADEKGEPLNDLPLDLSATADVLNLGVTDFVIVDRSGDRSLLHVRIEGMLSGKIPYAGNTTVADMPYSSLNFLQSSQDDSGLDEFAVAKRRHEQLLRRAARSEDSLVMISSDDSSSSFDTMRRQTSLESLAPDVITVFKMDTDDRISVTQALSTLDELSASSPIPVDRKLLRKRDKAERKLHHKKKRESGSFLRKNEVFISHSASGAISSLQSTLDSASGQERSSSGHLVLSCRRWGTERWKVAQELSIAPNGSVKILDKPQKQHPKLPPLQRPVTENSLTDTAEIELTGRTDTNNQPPKVSARSDLSSPWFEDFSYSSPTARKKPPYLPMTPDCASSQVRKQRASSSPSSSFSGVSSLHLTPATSVKDFTQGETSSLLSAQPNPSTPTSALSRKSSINSISKGSTNNFFSTAHNEHLLRKRSSIILVPAAGDPGLERRHSERPYDEDNDVIDILKYRRQTPALQTIFPHTSQPFNAVFSPKHSTQTFSSTYFDGSSAQKFKQSASDDPMINMNDTASDTDNGYNLLLNNSQTSEDYNNNNPLSTIHENKHLRNQNPQQFRERRMRAMSTLSNSTKGDGYDSDFEHMSTYSRDYSKHSQQQLLKDSPTKKKPKDANNISSANTWASQSNDDVYFEHYSTHHNVTTYSDDDYESLSLAAGDEENTSSQHSTGAILSATVLASSGAAQSRGQNGNGSNNSSKVNRKNLSTASNASILSTSATAAMLLSYKSATSYRSNSPFRSSVSSQPGSDHTPNLINSNNTNANGNGSSHSSLQAADVSTVMHRPQHQRHHHHRTLTPNSSNFNNRNNGNNNNNNSNNVRASPLRGIGSSKGSSVSSSQHRHTPPLPNKSISPALSVPSSSTAGVALGGSTSASLRMSIVSNMSRPAESTSDVSLLVAAHQLNHNLHNNCNHGHSHSQSMRSARSSGYSTPTQQQSRSSFTGFFSSPIATTVSHHQQQQQIGTSSASNSRRGSTNSSFFGRLYESLVGISRTSSPAPVPPVMGTHDHFLRNAEVNTNITEQAQDGPMVVSAVGDATHGIQSAAVVIATNVVTGLNSSKLDATAAEAVGAGQEEENDEEQYSPSVVPVRENGLGWLPRDPLLDSEYLPVVKDLDSGAVFPMGALRYESDKLVTPIVPPSVLFEDGTASFAESVVSAGTGNASGELRELSPVAEQSS